LAYPGAITETTVFLDVFEIAGNLKSCQKDAKLVKLVWSSPRADPVSALYVGHNHEMHVKQSVHECFVVSQWYTFLFNC